MNAVVSRGARLASLLGGNTEHKSQLKGHEYTERGSSISKPGSGTAVKAYENGMNMTKTDSTFPFMEKMAQKVNSDHFD